jgi:hypothetical protein
MSASSLLPPLSPYSRYQYFDPHQKQFAYLPPPDAGDDPGQGRRRSSWFSRNGRNPAKVVPAIPTSPAATISRADPGDDAVVIHQKMKG